MKLCTARKLTICSASLLLATIIVSAVSCSKIETKSDTMAQEITTKELPVETKEVTANIKITMTVPKDAAVTSCIVDTTEEIPAVESEYNFPITDYEYNLLCKIVASEYGGMEDVCERAKIVASVMNQTYRTGNSIEDCLYTSCVPWGFNPDAEWFCGGTVYYQDMADAVDYYFANRYTVFADWDADSWYASGYGTNIFHRQLW